MNTPQQMRDQAASRMQGTMALAVAFIGISNFLFAALAETGTATADELAAKTGLDSGYLERWCDAAFAFGFLDVAEEKFGLTDLGRAFIPETPGTLMPFAAQSMLAAHLAGRTVDLMKSGERPGEKVLAEDENILKLFGPMLEAMFGGVFEQQILPHIPEYREADEKGGLVVDLGCGNGWYLRKMALRFPHIRGVGLDGFEENINQATRLAETDGLGGRITFSKGDIHNFTVDEPVDLIAMNRALHHVWEEKEDVFGLFREHLNSGGAVIIWEPNWPRDRSALRDPARRGMAFQNLSEHVQGNCFLRPQEIQAEFGRVGMQATVHLFANGNEAVVVGRKD